MRNEQVWQVMPPSLMIRLLACNGIPPRVDGGRIRMLTKHPHCIALSERLAPAGQPIAGSLQISRPRPVNPPSCRRHAAVMPPSTV